MALNFNFFCLSYGGRGSEWIYTTLTQRFLSPTSMHQTHHYDDYHSCGLKMEMFLMYVVTPQVILHLIRRAQSPGENLTGEDFEMMRHLSDSYVFDWSMSGDYIWGQSLQEILSYFLTEGQSIG